MPKFSVKKPYTILVAVIACIVIGAVALLQMTTDLLPQLSLPYLMVVTTEIGASAERIETDVSVPLENALGTLNGVVSVTSTSNENYSLIQLQFEEDTDMDNALVRVTAALNTAKSSLPDNAGTPQIIEVSMDMLATMYAAVSMDGADIYEISDFTEDVVIQQVSRANGIASVSATGLVEKQVVIELNEEKIDDVNTRILSFTNDKLAEAADQLREAKWQVVNGENTLREQQAQFGSMLTGGLVDQLRPGLVDLSWGLYHGITNICDQLEAIEDLLREPYFAEIRGSLIAIRDEIGNITSETDIEAMVRRLQDQVSRLSNALGQLSQRLEELRKSLPERSETSGGDIDAETIANMIDQITIAMGNTNYQILQLPEMVSGVATMMGTLTQAQLDAAVGFATGSAQLATAKEKLEEAQKQFDEQRDAALENANMSQLMNAAVFSQLIYAQNFEMPAGYINDESDNTWLLKIGQTYRNTDQIEDTVLASIDGIGDIRVKDVADVTTIDNAGESYARVNENEAIVISLFKSGSFGTNEAANNALKAFDRLEKEYPGLKFTVLMNQGDYITMIINSVTSSMLVGAVLAIIVLALFLKDIKPTLVVAISIPLSVLFAIVLMYFWGLSMNMMTLSGLSLGIGMLVDNSVVVMENIYRLRARGVAAPRAAVQGTKQVAGSIISSTLTTVCVFMPMLFTEGTVRSLLAPMGLTITFTLVASLIVAMTVVPASASTLLKNTQEKKHPWMDKLQTLYGKVLRFFLRRKIVPLAVAIGLLAFTISAVMKMGIVIIPEMSSGSIEVSLKLDEEEYTDRDEAYEVTDSIILDIIDIPHVDTAGFMGSSGNMLGGMMGGSTGATNFNRYTGYILMEEKTSPADTVKAVEKINALADKYGVELKASVGGMSDLGALMSSGMSVNIYGSDAMTREEISEDLMDMIRSIDGFDEVTNGMEDGDPTIYLKINRNEAMKKGLTVAQVYQDIAMNMMTESSSTSIIVDGVSLNVKVVDHTNELTVEKLLDHEVNANGEKIPLRQIAAIEKGTSTDTVKRENQVPYMTVNATVKEGENVTLLSRELEKKLAAYDVKDGYSISIGGESQQVNEMVYKMGLMMALAFVLIYLVMVAQFQSLLSPFIVLFTIPLAFTGGLLGLLIARMQLSIISLMGFLVLMGTVVNNGIVFVDYTNQLRLQGMEKRDALVAAGRTRMRPIWMTALTTILAMFQLMTGDDIGSQLSGGMAVVISGGLLYATFMTLFIVPILYDLMFRKEPKVIDVGSDTELDDIPDDAAEFIAQMKAERAERRRARQAAKQEAEEAIEEEIETSEEFEEDVYEDDGQY